MATQGSGTMDDSFCSRNSPYDAASSTERARRAGSQRAPSLSGSGIHANMATQGSGTMDD
eukprot:CAMPEP_0173424372 /NCGR_PEP_ID=MMETSP1357-20121228/4298_1 /TAXON_ID=77926 /ORGANISM="Hemiselmis rufescens, Strain PCC563" /LENGTH=59 /DNA_ID=CAMNT_0014387585 /DNA_START=65 /DNA_END=241 /DNA_ORIENTATION=-